MTERLPLIVLAGSDRHRGSVPRGLHASDMLVGYKGALTLPDGAPLVGGMMQRFRESGRFEEPILVGPARVYGSLGLGCEVVDSEGPLASTLNGAVRVVSERYSPDAAVAFTACDILPSAAELRTLMADGYDPAAGSVFWSQLVTATPGEMGTSGWKPGYAMATPSGGYGKLYPGHLVVVRRAGLRFEILTRLLHLAYRYRNRALWQRALGMTVEGIGSLVHQDIRNLRRAQAPVLTVSIPWHCISGYLRYCTGRFSVSDMERTIARIFVHRDVQRTAGNRPVVFSVTRALSFARDVDTRAEFEELVGGLQ